MTNNLGYFDVAFPSGEPVWTTENHVVATTKTLRLRCFRSGPGEATLVIPPQAGHKSTIADYDKGQSLIQTILSSTTGPVYSIDWLGATSETKGQSLDGLVNSVTDMIFRYLGQVHLVGLCQGGWLAALIAARFPGTALSLTCIASPIDFHKDGGHIYETITELGMGPYKDIVKQAGGIMPGAMMLLGWKMMDPVGRYLGDYMDIWTDVLLGDEKKLKRTKRFRLWYETVQDLAGVWYLDVCERLFLKNLLVQGKLEILGEMIDLSKITCPIVMIAGEDDEITLRGQVYALGDHASSLETLEILIPKCGHIGCFMGTKSQAYIAEAMRNIHQ